MADPGGEKSQTEQSTEQGAEDTRENSEQPEPNDVPETPAETHEDAKDSEKGATVEEQSPQDQNKADQSSQNQNKVSQRHQGQNKVEKTPQNEHKVDLSTLKTKYNTKSHSTMTNVLTEYGLPVEKKHKPKAKPGTANKKRQSRKLQREATFDSMTSGDGDRMSKAKQEKYMQVYEDIHKLRDYFYEDYMNKLNRKIERQRDDIQKKSEAMDNRLREKEEQQRSHRLKKRLERVDTGNNEEYLKKIHKSDYYKIITLQDKLMNDGKLKNQGDIDDYWRNIRRPEVFKEHFPDTPSESTNSRYSGTHSQSHSLTSSLSSLDRNPGATVIQPDYQPLTQIEETAENSRPVTREGKTPERETWAITQQAQAVHRAPAKRLPDPYTKARTAAIELDKKYPMIELPKLNCMDSSLDLAQIELHQILKEKEKERREKERRLFVMRLRRMYHLTQSNQASAQRILERHADEFELARNGAPLSELMALSVDPGESQADRPPKDVNAERPWLRHLVSKRRDIQTIDELPEEDVSARGSSVPSSAGVSGRTSASSKRSKKLDKVPTPPPPISHQLLEDVVPVKEAQCVSTLWTNYLRIGFHGDLAQQT